MMNFSDDAATTDYLNRKSFSEDEIKVYPYHLRKTYVADVDYQDNYSNDEYEFYATSDREAYAYLDRTVGGKNVTFNVCEKIITYRELN